MCFGDSLVLYEIKKDLMVLMKNMVEQQGFKPWTSALQRRRSNQLSYCPSNVILAEKLSLGKVLVRLLWWFLVMFFSVGLGWVW